MKIWTEICIEPSGVNTIDDEHTIVLYLSEKKVKLKEKTRPKVVKCLLKMDIQVFGACAPVNKHVIQRIKNLNGKELTQNIIDELKRRIKKYTPYKYSRVYPLIIHWLTFELEGKRTKKSAFRTEIRAGRIT